MQITIKKDELKILIKEAIREVLKEESIKNFLSSVPYISDEEMKEIEAIHGKPTDEKIIAFTREIDV